MLSSRHTTLDSFHYEALLEAYLSAGDLQTTFRILVIMAKAGIEPDINSTRAIYLHLVADHRAPGRAWDIIEQLHEDGHAIPTGAVNVILESMVRNNKHFEAIEMYKKSYPLCKGNTDTFNILLRRLASNRDGPCKHAAMFLASEMQALGLKPDQLTYDRLILICVMEKDDYEDAFLYWHEMKAVGKQRTGKEWLLRPGTLSILARRCVRLGDERAWNILKLLGERRPEEALRMMQWAEKWWKTAEGADTSEAEWPLLTSNEAF